MQPPAHRPLSESQQQHLQQAHFERDLFFENLGLVLQHERAILSCDEYFFCKPAFANHGCYSSGDINLGTLLLGWRAGSMTDICRQQLGPRKARYTCGGVVLVCRFGGLLSKKGFEGYCAACHSYDWVWDSTRDTERSDFVSSANRQFKDWEELPDEFEMNRFTYTEQGVRPGLRVVETVSVKQLIQELQTGAPAVSHA